MHTCFPGTLSFASRWLLFFLVFLCGVGAAPAQNAAAPAPEYVQGQIVVKVKPAYHAACSQAAVSVPDFQRLLATFGATVGKKFPNATPPTLREIKGEPRVVDISTIYDIHYAGSQDPREVARQFARLSCVEYAEPEYIYQPLTPVFPNDMSTLPSWVTRMKMAEGWGIQQGDTNVVIAIIDSGTQWDHEDLEGNMKFNWNDPINGLDDDGDGYIDNFMGWDFVGADGTVVNGRVSIEPDNDPRPRLTGVPSGMNVTPSLGHGTWVAGYAAAVTNNELGTVGASFNCKFMPIKLMHDWNGVGLFLVNNAIVYAADMGVQVMNLSLGGPNFSQVQQDAVNYATFNRNVAVVAAAGNGISEQYVYPASHDNVLSVTTVGDDDLLRNAYGKKVDVAALGTALTTDMEFGYRIPPGGHYSSISSPLAAGVVALIRARYPSFTAQQANMQARVTADDLYALNTNAAYQLKLGKGRLNLERALTLQRPGIRGNNWRVEDDDDNTADPGDVIYLRGTVQNLLAPAQNLRVSVTTSDPYLTPLSTLTDVGALGSQQQHTLSGNALSFQIGADAPTNHVAQLVFFYEDGDYLDFEHFSITLNPSFLDVQSGNVATSVGSDAKWGQNGYSPNPWQGRRFQLNERNDYLWEGAFLIGTSAATCANNLRAGGGVHSNHFTSVQKPRRTLNPNFSDEEVVVRFNDGGLGSQAQGLNITQHAYGFADEGFSNLVIFKYEIENTQPFTLSNQYAAIAADWDFENNPQQDSAGYDAERQLLYAWGLSGGEIASRNACNAYTGMVLLSDDVQPTARTLNAANFEGTASEKFDAISQGTTLSTMVGVDVLQFMGAGPFSLLPLGKREVAFAIIGACSLEELQAVADTARSKFQCMFKETALTVQLGADTIVCGSYAVDGTVDGAVSYSWEPANVGSNPQQTFTTSGLYRLTAQDEDGCPYQDQFSLTVIQPLAPVVSLSHDTLNLYLNEALVFADSTPNTTAWTWDFDDGYGFSGQAGEHRFLAPGTYTLSLSNSNGVCDGSFTQQVVVIDEIPANRKVAAGRGIQVYPNPVQAGHTLTLSHAKLAGQTTRLEVHSVTGQLVLQTTLPATDNGELRTELPPNLPAGVYMASLRSSQGSMQFRIVVQ